MKGQHLRRAPYRPNVEFAIGLLGLAVCVLGIGLVMADVFDRPRVRISSQKPTTTTTVIALSVIEPETTTTVESTTTTTAQLVPTGRPRAVTGRSAQIGTATSIVKETATTTTD